MLNSNTPEMRMILALQQQLQDLEAQLGTVRVLFSGEGGSGATLDRPTLVHPVVTTGAAYNGEKPTEAEASLVILGNSSSLPNRDAHGIYMKSPDTDFTNWVVGTGAGSFVIVHTDGDGSFFNGGLIMSEGDLVWQDDGGTPSYTLAPFHGGSGAPISKSIVDAKGDLISATAADTPARLAVGTDGQFLTASSGAGTGLAWATHGASGDPHSQYATDTDLTNHVGAADPHTGYRLESAAITAADIANRTRTIPLIPVGGVALATDTHGSFNDMPHWDFPDSVDSTLYFAPIRVPDDYVSGTMSINILWSNSVGSNNWRRRFEVEETEAGDTAETSLVGNSANVAVAAANTKAVNSRDLGTNPTAGHVLSPWVRRVGTDSGNDTNTGVTSIWGAWLSYTADS